MIVYETDIQTGAHTYGTDIQTDAHTYGTDIQTDTPMGQTYRQTHMACEKTVFMLETFLFALRSLV